MVYTIQIHQTHTKHGPLEKGMGKPLQYSCLENPMNSMKRQKYMTLKDELPKSIAPGCPTCYWRGPKTLLQKE